MLLANHGFVFPLTQISFVGAISFMGSCIILERRLYTESAHENNK